MQNTKVKKIILLILIFLLAMSFQIKSFGAELVASGDVKSENSKVSNKSFKTTKSYSHPSFSDNTQLGQDGFWISKTVGFFCCWHGYDHSIIPGWASKTPSEAKGDVVNDWRYIFAQGDGKEMQAKKDAGDHWGSEFVQRFIWWMEAEGTGKYDFKGRMGLTEVHDNKTSTAYDFTKLKRANEDYNEKYWKNVHEKGIKDPKVSFVKDEIKVYQNSNTGVTYIGQYQMNDYSSYYSANCQYSNRLTNYSGYGKVSYGKKRGGVLTGIVNAHLEIKSGDETIKLEWEKGDFKFAYGTVGKDTGDKGKQEGYDLFPGPNAKFYVKIADLKGLTLSGNVVTTLKFDSITVEANEYKNNDAYIIHRIQEETPKGTIYGQPALNCGGKMKVGKCVSLVKASVNIEPVAKINVYIEEVKGGGKSANGNTAASYHYIKDKLQCVSGNTGNLFKAGTTKGEAGRRKWGEAKKKLHRVAAEKGDTIKFRIVITNVSDYTLTVDSVKLEGCISTAQGSKKINDKVTNNFDNIDIMKGSKIASGKTYEFTCEVEDVVANMKYLKATLGKVRKASNDTVVSNSKSTKVASADYYLIKKYNVTIDKYISGSSEAVSKESGNGSTGDDSSDIEDVDLTGSGESGEEFAEDADGVGEFNDTDDSKEVDDAVAEASKIYLSTLTPSTGSATKRVWGRDYQAINTNREPIYYYGGEYFYFDSSFEVMFKINIQSDGSGYYYTESDIQKTSVVEHRRYLNWNPSVVPDELGEPVCTDSTVINGVGRR